MLLNRRHALTSLAALSLPLSRAGSALAAQAPSDPLAGTIVDYQAGRRRGDWTAVEVTTQALERCRTDGARWRAIDMLSQTALREARAADARLRAGCSLGPLDGAPLFAKSIYDMAGLPTTASSADWARLFPGAVQREAVEIKRMRAAGAVILGKTAVDDFAYRGNGTSSHTGQVLNPYDASGTRTPGGSSAGSAVAVAAGMAFAALGTDDVGSNRIPAQFTGVVGIKPTFGSVPRTGVVPTWPYLDTHGSLARTVADAMLLLAVIAGGDGVDPLALATPFDMASLAQLSDGALHGVRLGVVEEHVFHDRLTSEALATWGRALSDLRAAGADVGPFAAPITRLNYREAFAEAAKARGDAPANPNSPGPTANALYAYFAGRTRDPWAAVRLGYDAFRKFYDVLPERFADAGPLFTTPMANDPEGRSFARSRAEVVAQLADSMRAAGVQAMVYPTMPFNAPRAVDAWPYRTALGYTNWLGLPEVSVPAGIGADGMPALNLSIVGLPGDDALVLALAHAYERKSRRFVPPR